MVKMQNTTVALIPVELAITLRGYDHKTEIRDLDGKVLKTLNSHLLGQGRGHMGAGYYLFDGRYLYDPHYTTGPHLVDDTDSPKWNR